MAGYASAGGGRAWEAPHAQVKSGGTPLASVVKDSVLETSTAPYRNPAFKRRRWVSKETTCNRKKLSAQAAALDPNVLAPPARPCALSLAPAC